MATCWDTRMESRLSAPDHSKWRYYEGKRQEIESSGVARLEKQTAGDCDSCLPNCNGLQSRKNNTRGNCCAHAEPHAAPNCAHLVKHHLARRPFPSTHTALTTCIVRRGSDLFCPWQALSSPSLDRTVPKISLGSGYGQNLRGVEALGGLADQNNSS